MSHRPVPLVVLALLLASPALAGPTVQIRRPPPPGGTGPLCVSLEGYNSVKLLPCGEAAIDFTMNEQGHLRDPRGLCLRLSSRATDVAGGQGTSRTIRALDYWMLHLLQADGQLDLNGMPEDCTTWTRSNGALQAPTADLGLVCLEPLDADSLKAAPCNGSEAQRWSVESPDPNKRDADGNTALHRAILDGADHDALTEILDMGTDIDLLGADGDAALHTAVRRGDRELIRFLVDRGADKFKPSDNGGEQPLHIAVRAGDEDLARYLIGLGASPSNTDGQLRSALRIGHDVGVSRGLIELMVDEGARADEVVLAHYVEAGDLPMLERMIRAGLPTDRVLDASMARLDTRLVRRVLELGGKPTREHVQKAVAEWHSELLTVLLEFGGSPDQALELLMQGETNMLMVGIALEAGALSERHLATAVGRNDTALVDAFVEYGANPQVGVMTAVQASNQPMILHLRSLGADITRAEYLDHWVHQEGLGMMDFLIEHGAKPAGGVATALSHSKPRALAHLYRAHGVKVTREHLISSISGANPTVLTVVLDQGIDPDLGMEHAVKVNGGAQIKVLVQRGADATKKALIVAAVRGDKDAAAGSLLAAGARADWTVDDGGTQLVHVAAQQCSPTMPTLLFYKADANARDAKGDTPLHIVASGKGCREHLDVLLDHGAEVNATDAAGQTPRAVARGVWKKRTLKKAGGEK